MPPIYAINWKVFILKLFHRLRTGWSSRSPDVNLIRNSRLANRTNDMNNNSHENDNNIISDNEFIEIEKVMQRASLIQNKETERIK